MHSLTLMMLLLFKKKKKNSSLHNLRNHKQMAQTATQVYAVFPSSTFPAFSSTSMCAQGERPGTETALQGHIHLYVEDRFLTLDVASPELSTFIFQTSPLTRLQTSTVRLVKQASKPKIPPVSPVLGY